MGKPVVVQGTAVASPYDHTTTAAQPTDQPTAASRSGAPSDPEGGGEKQVRYGVGAVVHHTLQLTNICMFLTGGLGYPCG